LGHAHMIPLGHAHMIPLGHAHMIPLGHAHMIPLGHAHMIPLGHAHMIRFGPREPSKLQTSTRTHLLYPGIILLQSTRKKISSASLAVFHASFTCEVCVCVCVCVCM
jgi:hypothetical protein